MLYRKDNEWALCPIRVRYLQHGKELEQYTHDKQWWIDFANKWDHTEIIEFIDVAYTDNQLARLEEIKNIPDGYDDICSSYVEFGTFPTGANHKLRNLQLEKENTQLGIELSEREINEIIQGMQISEIEIELLELKMGGV